MPKLPILALSLLLCTAIPTQSFAQNAPNTATAYRANPRFDFMVNQATAQQNEYFNFGQLRRYYMQTRQYDPLGDTTIEQLLRLSYEAENAEDPEQAARTFGEFRLLVKDHFAHLRVVLYALSLARSDHRYGDPTLYAWLREGLIRNVMVSGDGETLDGAYDVITPIEETALLRQLNLTTIKTVNKSEGYYRYNIHTAKDKATGATSRIFVNTTFPMKFLEQQYTPNFSLGSGEIVN